MGLLFGVQYSEEAFCHIESHYFAFHTLRVDKDLNFVST